MDVCLIFVLLVLSVLVILTGVGNVAFVFSVIAEMAFSAKMLMRWVIEGLVIRFRKVVYLFCFFFMVVFVKYEVNCCFFYSVKKCLMFVLIIMASIGVGI